MRPSPPHRNRPRVSAYLAAGLVVSVAACSDGDRPVEPEPPAPSAALRLDGTRSQPPSGDIPTLRRFDVAVEASGTFRPGAPIALHVRVTGLSDVSGAEIRVVLPEVAGAVGSAWGEGFRYPAVGEPVRPALTRSFEARRGGFSEFMVPVEVPAEGYYHVVTTVRAPEATPLVEDGRWALNTTVNESWLLITEAGGELTRTFETDRIPASYLRQSGPFRAPRGRLQGMRPGGGEPMPMSDADPIRESDLGQSGPFRFASVGVPRRRPAAAASNRAAPVVHGSAAGASLLENGLTDITYQLKYYDVDAGSFQPLAHAYAIVYLCTLPVQQFICEPEDFEQYTATGTDSNGYVSFPCQEDEYILEISTYKVGRFVVHYGVVQAEGNVASDCGNSFELTMLSTRAKIFKDLHATVAGAMSMFGEARSFIDVWEDGENEYDNSYYDRGDDEIHILTDHVWDGFTEFGAFVVAHEYGHAFHEDALLGNEGGSCPNRHYLDTESGLPCAFSEGFANYFASVARPDLTSRAAYFENNNAFPGCVSRNANHECTGGISYEGSVIEGAFAAFLYDLTDSTVEPYDSIAAPGSYVADLIETCKINYYGALYRANGPDDIAYCVENAVDPGSCFTVRGWVVSGYQEGAQEPTGWTAGRANGMWRWNLYEKPDSTVSC